MSFRRSRRAVLVLVGRVEPGAVVREGRLRERDRPAAGGHLGAVVDRERVHEVGVVAGDDEEPARRGVDDRRAADPVASGHEVGGPDRQPGRLVERNDVGVGDVGRGEREEEARACGARGGLAPGGARRAARARGARPPGRAPTPSPAFCVLPFAGNVALASNVVSGFIIGAVAAVRPGSVNVARR